jgi:hypothetical protein
MIKYRGWESFLSFMKGKIPMLEKMAEWGIVKFIGSLISPENLGKRIEKVMELYNTNSFMSAAKRLFFWAIFIIVIATAIDLVFYWLRPEQKVRLMHYKERFFEYKDKWLGSRTARGRQSKR